MPVETTAAGAAVLEIERFEWVTPELIEIAGYWSGLRGRRFMRPTLVLKGEGEPRRLLATLDHKPWTAHDDEEWVVAFAWSGPVEQVESAELNVGSGIDLELPPPRLRPGNPRRFRQRVVAHDATREPAPAQPRPSGIVSDAPAKAADPVDTKAADAKPAGAPRKTPKRAGASTKAKAGKADAPKQAKAGKADAPAKAPKQDAAANAPKADAPTKAPAAKAATAEAATAEAAAVDTAPAADPAAELQAKLDRIRGERDAMRRERDQAYEKLRAVRGELEAERQSREKAVADARAAERENANRMLAEGAELRAAIERQREIAYLERDDAKAARDEAIVAAEDACDARDEALAEAKDARRERKEALAQRDRAMKLQQRAEEARDEAIAEREAAIAERDDAVSQRDEIVRIHERGLPVHPPKPRFLPDGGRDRSELDIWAPRGVAIGVLLILAFVVLRMFAGL